MPRKADHVPSLCVSQLSRLLSQLSDCSRTLRVPHVIFSQIFTTATLNDEINDRQGKCIRDMDIRL